MATKEDVTFAQLAVQKQFVTKEQAKECLEAQKTLVDQKQSADLETIMVQKGYVTQVQAGNIREIVKKKVAEQKIAGYEIVQKLGEGGMGSVFKARQISMDRIVALKLLPPALARDKSFVERFRREAQATARLDHKNIIRGLEVGQDGKQWYFAMEFVEGDSLRKILDRDGPLTPARALDLMKQMANALIHAHEKGFIHRDIKPDNILVTPDGIAKLADLGLAKDTDAQMTAVTESGSSMGTPYYMPPEQSKDAKRADHRSDIYALGATFYHALVGKVPYEGDSPFDVMQKHETEQPVPPDVARKDIPHRLSRLILKTMEKNPDDRFESAQKLLAALDTIKVEGEEGDMLSSDSGVAPRRTPSPQQQATIVEQQRKPRAEWKHKRKGIDGRDLTTDYSTEALVRAIKSGTIGPDAAVRKATEKEYKRASEYPQLAKVFSAKLEKDVKAKKEREKQTPSLAKAYLEMEKEHKRRQMTAKIKRYIKIAVILGILGGGAYFCYKNEKINTFFRTKVIGKIMPKK